MLIPNEVAESRIHKRLGELIEALIADADIRSERKLSRITDVSFTALANWSSFKADPQLLKLIKFAYNLGWSMTELMCFAEGDEDVKEAIARKKEQPPLQAS